MKTHLHSIVKLLTTKMVYQPVMALLVITGFVMSQATAMAEPGTKYIYVELDMGDEETLHLCIDFVCGNGISSCDCPCTVKDQDTAGETDSTRSAETGNPIQLMTGGVIERAEDIRVTTNSFTYTHKREQINTNEYWNELGAKQGLGWTNALSTQLLMEAEDEGVDSNNDGRDDVDPDVMYLMLDSGTVRVFTREGATDWFKGPDDSYARLYHNTTDNRYEVINNQSGEVLYFEDQDGTDGGVTDPADAYFLTTRTNAHADQRLRFVYGDFDATDSVDPYIKSVRVEHWDATASQWDESNPDRQIDYVYKKINGFHFLKEIRVWADGDTSSTGHVSQWVRYTYYGETFTVGSAQLSPNVDSGWAKYAFNTESRSLVMVENYTAGTGQKPSPDDGNGATAYNSEDPLDPADFAGNKVTMYRYSSFYGYSGAVKAVYEPDAVERMVASGNFVPTGGTTEHDTLVNILATADDTGTIGTIDENDVLYYASRTFDYYWGDPSTSSVTTAFGSEDLESKYGGTGRNEKGQRVKSETVNRGQGGVRLDYYYMRLNAAVAEENIGLDMAVYLVVEDTVDADDNAVYRKLYAMNKQGILLREVLIEDPTAQTPKYWCTSHIVGTSGRGTNKTIELRPPSAHTKVDTEAELKKFLDPTGNSGANDTDTLNGTGEGGRVYITDYTDAAGSYTVTTGVKDLSVSTTDVNWLGYQHFVEYGTTITRYRLDEVYVEPDFGTTTKPTPGSVADNDAIHCDYAFYDADEEQIKTKTMKAPVVTTGENGSGQVTTSVEYFDEAGRKRWIKDGEGNVTYLAHDKINGQRALVVRDVDTTDTLPTKITATNNAWVAWTGGIPTEISTGAASDSKLNLIQTTEFDGQTRPRKVTDAEDVDTFIAYQGNTTLVFAGWEAEAGTTNKPDLPIAVSVTNDAGQPLASYTLPNTVTITGSGTDDPSNVSGVDHGDYLSWMRYSYNRFSQLEHADRFHDIPAGTTTPVEVTHFYRDYVFYDDQGRVETTVSFVDGTTANTSSTEQVNQVVYDVLHRVEEVKTAVSGTGHSILSGGDLNTTGLTFKTLSKAFYDESTPGNGTSGIGDSLVTSVHSFSDASDTGVYVETRYHRNGRAQLRGITRAGKASGGSETLEGPYVAVLPDNLGRTIGSAVFEDGDEPTWTENRATWSNRFRTDSTGVTGRRALTRHEFDLRGQRYHSDTYNVRASDGVALGRTESDLYFDRNGQLVGATSTAGGAAEIAYDGALRPYQQRMLTALEATKYTSGAFNYRAPVPTPGEPSGGKIPGTGGDDKVLTLNHRVFNDVGNVLRSIGLEAKHGDTGLTLTGAADYVQAAVHRHYDNVHRLIGIANYGTSADTYTHANLPAYAASVPASSDTVLVTGFEYDEASRLLETTNPEGTAYRRGYDDLFRTIYSVANYENFNFSTEAGTGGGTGNNDDQVTKRVYNALNQVKELVALDRDGNGNLSDNQTTTYTYGDSYLAHVLAEIEMPDHDAAATPDDVVKFTYHLNGQLKTRTDQRGVVVTPAYDVIRRLQAREVTTIPAGSEVDATVRAITYGRDNLGRVDTVTSHGNVTSDPTNTADILNQIKYTFHDHHALKKERQDHDSAVDAAGGLSTLEVEYAFDETLDTGVYENALRPTYITYPNGVQVHTTYGSSGSIDDLISRATGLADEHATTANTPGDAIATYTWMGGGTMAKKVLDVPGIELNRIDPDGSAPTAGLEGLDRFGRVAAQAWQNTTGGADRLHTEHGYDRIHRTLYADRLTNPGLSQSYSYDQLHRLDGFAIGVLERDSGGDVELTGTPGRASTDDLYTLISEDHDLDLLHNAVAIEDDATTDKVQQAVNDANELEDSSGGADRTVDPTQGSKFKGPSFSNTSDKDDFEPALDLTASEFTSEVSVSGGVLKISDGDASASAPAALLAAPKYGTTATTIRVRATGATSGRAGVLLGYKSDDDYWLYVVDFALTSGNAKFIHVTNGGATENVIYSYTRSADSNGWYSLYLLRNVPNAFDHFISGTDLTADGGLPSGRMGLYTEVDADDADTEFNYLWINDTQFPHELSAHWSASSRNVVVDKGSGDGALFTSGAWDRQTLPTLLEGVRTDTFRLTFKTTRASGQPFAKAYLVLGHRGAGDYAMLSILHDDGASNNYDLNAYEVIDGATQAVSGDQQTVLDAADTDTVWYRVECDGTDVTVHTLKQSTTPSESNWSSATLAWQTTSTTDRFDFTAEGGGQIGFLTSSYTTYIDDLTVETDHDSDGTWTVEHVETFDLNTSDQIEEDLEYDAAGNLVFDGRFKYTFDAFNRLYKAEKAYRDSNDDITVGSENANDDDVATVVYAYDGQHRLIQRHAKNVGELSQDCHFYCAGPRNIEERLIVSGTTQKVAKQYVWGLTYIDELVRVGVSHTLTHTSTKVSRHYYALTDKKFSVQGLVDEDGDWVQRNEFAPDGRTQRYSRRAQGRDHVYGDLDGDGDVDDADYSVRSSNWTGPGGSGKTYDQGDLDGDGDVDDVDALWHSSAFTGPNAWPATNDPDLQTPTRGDGKMRDPHGMVALCSIGFQGLMEDEVTENTYQRARWYSARLVRFMSRDPLGYPDGMNTNAAYHVLEDGWDPSGTFITGVGVGTNQVADAYEESTGSRPYINPITGQAFGHDDRDHTIDKPGFGESLIPVWGSGKSALYHAQQGNYWTAGFYAVLTVSDCFLVSAIAKGCLKVGWKAFTTPGVVTFFKGTWDETLHFAWKVGDDMYHALRNLASGGFFNRMKSLGMSQGDMIQWVQTGRLPLFVLSKELAKQTTHSYNCFTTAYTVFSRANFHLDYFIFTALVKGAMNESHNENDSDEFEDDSENQHNSTFDGLDSTTIMSIP